jgi:hypothetical protein
MAASRAGLKRKGQRHDEGEMLRPSPPPAPPKPAYAPTPAEVEQVRAHAERRRARPSRAYHTLGDLQGRLALLEVRCRRCDRHGRLRLARLIAEHGADAALPILRHALAGLHRAGGVACLPAAHRTPSAPGRTAGVRARPAPRRKGRGSRR